MPIKDRKNKSKKIKQLKPTVCEYSNLKNSNHFIVQELSNATDMFVSEKDDHIEGANNVPNKKDTSREIELIILDDSSNDSFEENHIDTYDKNVKAGCDINLKIIQTKEKSNLIINNGDKHINGESEKIDTNDDYANQDSINYPEKVQENNKETKLIAVSSEPVFDINLPESSKIKNVCNGINSKIANGVSSSDNVKFRLRQRKQKNVCDDLTPITPESLKNKNSPGKKSDANKIKFSNKNDDSNKSNEIAKPLVKVDNERNTNENVVQQSILKRKNNEQMNVSPKTIKSLKPISENETLNTHSNDIIGIRRSKRKVKSEYSRSNLEKKRKIKQIKQIELSNKKAKSKLVETEKNSILEEENSVQIIDDVEKEGLSEQNITPIIDNVEKEGLPDQNIAQINDNFEEEENRSEQSSVQIIDDVEEEKGEEGEAKKNKKNSIDETIEWVVKHFVAKKDHKDKNQNLTSVNSSKNSDSTRIPNGPYVRVIVKKDKKFEKKLLAMKDEKSRYIATITDTEHYEDMVINKPEDLTAGTSTKKKKPQRKEKPIAAVHKKMRQSMIDTGTLYDVENWCCSLCKRKTDESFLGYLYGPYYDIKDYNFFYKTNDDSPSNYPSDYKPIEYWFHEDCFIWINIPKNRLIYNFIDAYAVEIINEYMETQCGKCKKLGASIMCKIKPCKLALHYPCAKELDFSFEEEKCRILCPIHYEQMMEDIPPEDKHPGLL